MARLKKIDVVGRYCALFVYLSLVYVRPKQFGRPSKSSGRNGGTRGAEPPHPYLRVYLKECDYYEKET